MNDDYNLKIQHKDSFFRGLFKKPEHFLYLLDRCSNGSLNFSPGELTNFNLKSDHAGRVRYNDVSFLTKDNRLLILIEHQSRVSPNMALRMFIYYHELLQMWIKQQQHDLFGVKIDVPVPELFVAYNGLKPLSLEEQSLKIESNSIKVDVKVKIVDISFDKLTDKAEENILAGYSYFYKIYDAELAGGNSRDSAFMTAREACIKNGYLKGIVEKEEFIVVYKDVLDYNAQLRWEGLDEGIERGEVIGYQKAMAKIENLLVQKLISKIPIKSVQNEALYLGIEGKAFEKLVLAAYDKITGKGEKASLDLQQEAFRIKAEEHNKRNAGNSRGFVDIDEPDL